MLRKYRREDEENSMYVKSSQYSTELSFFLIISWLVLYLKLDHKPFEGQNYGLYFYMTFDANYRSRGTINTYK